MIKNTSSFILILMFMFGMTGVGSTGTTSAPTDMAPSNGDCPISCYVSTTGSNGSMPDQNTCLDPSAPCATIQHAIKMSNGTEACPVTIHVAAGTYKAHIDMDAWESLDGGWSSDFSQQWDFKKDGLEPTPAYATVIDGNDNGTCITQHGITGANINGFTIQNGRGIAGGIYLDHSHPTITYCTIKENYGESDSDSIRSAGGLYNRDSNPTVQNCAFKQNDTRTTEWRADINACAVLNEYSQAIFVDSSFSEHLFGNTPGYKGVGMVNVNSSPSITRCRFEENSGGMAAYCPLVNLDSTVDITDSIFYDNSNGEGGPGVMMNDGSTVTIINSQFLENYTVQTNSATTVSNNNSTCTIINSIFAGNNSIQAVYGGPIVGNYGSQCTIINSTFADNGFEKNDGPAVIMNKENSRCIVKNSILWGSRDLDWPLSVDPFDTDATSTLEVSYSNIDQDGFEGLEGNMRENPMFVSNGWDDNGTPDNREDDIWVGGDYHLQTDSPCVDSGTNDAAELPELDFEGNPRIMDGDDDGNYTVDIGALELEGATPPSDDDDDDSDDDQEPEDEDDSDNDNDDDDDDDGICFISIAGSTAAY